MTDTKESTGRYHIVYEESPAPGRSRFTVEPVADRNQKIDGQVFTNGGTSGTATKNDQRGGAIRREDSIITADNGYRQSMIIPPGVSPDGIIERLAKFPKGPERDAEWDRLRVRYPQQDADVLRPE